MENKDIEIEDLIYVEEDLSDSELISILFLLYGIEKPIWLLENIKSRTKNEKFLYNYAKDHSNWRTSIIQSLSIIGVFEIVENLGINKSEAINSLKSNMQINVGLKLLFKFCDACYQNTTSSFISYIKENCHTAKHCNHEMLEVYLLHLIISHQIIITKSIDHCDFVFITNFLKGKKFHEVENVLVEFPQKQNLDNSRSSSITSQVFRLPNEYETKSEDFYKTNRMLVLIINQEKFVRDDNPEVQHLLPDENLKERKGTEKDLKELRDLFNDFNYKIVVKTDLTAADILKEVNKAAKQASLFDGVIVCILSHGQEGVVYGHNSLPVSIKEIKDLICIPPLLDKPKILLIQACQGQKTQRVIQRITRSEIEHDGPSSTTLTRGSKYADFLVVWSTIEGFTSFRDIDEGTWFIQLLVQKIRELHKDHHFLDICTATISEIIKKGKEKNICMVPHSDSSFTRKFFFPIPLSDSNC
ncbi:CLUMA_CG002789, isoform A [Clunio marinus]|uniref:CLUMA_CG002789, isoform A n=1 Tax=Clunio marinus TaxID=568069 RepID=A0A1J1HLU3_9DIPT|nr:CLUMA_CG002789, isoform A [Clunio marinus]